MNNFKKISAIILAICTAASVFTSCKDDNETSSSISAEEQITEAVNTQKETIEVNVTNDKGGISVSFSENSVSFITEKNTATASVNSISDSKTTKSTVITTKAKTTKKAVVNDTISEKAVGIAMLTKSDPVKIGNHATIFIQGTPGKTYSIDFYETPSSKADSSALEDKKADANGFVSWSFKIKNTCDLGIRKVVIREENSNNYLETSITVK